jgi:hypothetical protein
MDLKIGSAGLVILAGAMLVAQSVEAQQVGTAAAVNPAAQARGSGGSRTVVIGQSIAHRERIQTTSAGSVQLLFLDKTSMTIGPNSDLAIDEYVYDPASNTGKLAATLTKGVMRFVGGQISHAGNAQISTPNALVGIRGGVGIFTTQGVFIGYGEGNVRSGSTSVTLGAGDYTQTQSGAPPTNPGPPPANFLQSVLAALQSQGGQGGGARATAGQVNQARTAASGTSGGTIATNVQNVANQSANLAAQANTASSVNQTVQTTVNQTRAESIPPRNDTPPNNTPPDNTPPPPPGNTTPQQLAAFTGGLVSSRNNFGPFGPIIAALGGGAVQTNEQGQNDVAILGAARIGDITPGANPYNPYASPSDEFQAGAYQYGPNTANINIDDLAIGANVLLPATSQSGAPVAVVNSELINQFAGGVVEFKPGTALSNAASQTVGVQFCQCEYTRWGLWAAETSRPGQNVNGGPVEDTAEMFWVAGRLPASASDMPATGSATYTGHAIANIQSGSSPSYVAAGQFQNSVNFATRTGSVNVNNLDGASYAGQVMYGAGSPTFGGTLSAPNANRSMTMIGSFFQGRTSPVGEMGGALHITSTNGSNYGGAGIFAGRMQ